MPIIERFLPEHADKEKIGKWTIRTLFTHSTGFDRMMLKAKEVEGLTEREIFDLIFGTELKNSPNKDFVYNNVEAFLLSVIFQELFKVKLSDFANEHIFKTLGIENFRWTDYGKYCAGCTGLFLSAEDFHKLGLLILNDGKFEGKQVVPEWWVEEMVKPQILTPNAYKEDRVFPKYSAGYFTFQTKHGTVFRDGAGGQYIICDKKLGVLISVLSTEKDISKVTEIFRNTELFHK